jgi:hypothetical protein
MHSRTEKMDMKRVGFTVALVAAVSVGCFHRPSHSLRIGDEMIPPQGLDSAGTAHWIAQQRARCPGELHFRVDHMPAFSLDGSPVPYQSGIISVVCARR